MTNRFARLRREEFPVDDVRYQQLERAVQTCRERALELDSGIDREPDMGLDL
jgi:hypothetical protein